MLKCLSLLYVTKLLKDLSPFVSCYYKVIIKTNQETDKASISQEHCLSSGEKIGGFWGADVPGDSSDLSEAEQHSLGSARENTELVR